MTRWLSLAGWLALCLGVGAVGARWTAPAIPAWYRTLRKPKYNPPNWIFGPVWTMLYILMAVAIWHCQYAASPSDWRVASAVFLLQLALNLAWSWIFFHRHAILAALVELGVLWLAIVVELAVLLAADRFAAVLLVPYLAWVSFAFSLNAAIWRLNRR